MELPVPKIKRRLIDEQREKAACLAGLDPVLARIIAGRPGFAAADSAHEILSPKLKTLDSPHTLADIDRAVTRLLMALENREVIGIETDHDCDGQTSHAVIYHALIQFGHPPEKLRSYIGHRLKEGYGLSEKLTQRILADEPRPTLIITADNGSSDEKQIAHLKAQGIDVIVTDHHEIPAEGIPKSAYAVINPTREDCQYPDRCIAGCMVAWLVMAALRQKIMQHKGLEIPNLAQYLDFVAVGTIADCVSIARSRNNRAVVAYGMKLIQQGTRPCWRAILPHLSMPVSSEDLGFKIGPLLNSDGRLACAFGSVSFLLSQNDEQAKQWIEHLQAQNQNRKSIQDKVTNLALEQALIQFQAGKMSLCLMTEQGHAGVHGISASRIKDLFGRPVIILCPKEEDPAILTGSARSIEGLHLRSVLQTLDEISPNLMIRFGGHQGAAGLTLHRSALTQFTELFEQVVRSMLLPEHIGPVILTDGELPAEKINLPYIHELLQQLEPFGREFEPPLFEVNGKIMTIKIMGQTQIHAKLGLAVNDLWIEVVWFSCRKQAEDPLPVSEGDEVRIVFSPRLQVFRGEKQLSCQVIHVEKLASG